MQVLLYIMQQYLARTFRPLRPPSFPPRRKASQLHTGRASRPDCLKVRSPGRCRRWSSGFGLDLINRTTRSVEVTQAGLFLAVEAARLIGGVSSALDGLQSAFGSARPEVRVSVSRTLAMAHMPGLFHANHQRHPEVMCRVSYNPEQRHPHCIGCQRDRHRRPLPARATAGLREDRPLFQRHLRTHCSQHIGGPSARQTGRQAPTLAGAAALADDRRQHQHWQKPPPLDQTPASRHPASDGAG